MEEKLDIYTEDGKYSNEKIKTLIDNGYGKLALVKYIKDSGGMGIKEAKDIVDNACGNDTNEPKSGCRNLYILLILLIIIITIAIAKFCS